MTERDLIREVVEKSITRTVDIEVLRKWAKERFEEYVDKHENCHPSRRDYYMGQFVAYRKMIMKLDELEANG